MKIFTLRKIVVCLFLQLFFFSSFSQTGLKQYGRNTPNTCQSQCNQPSNERTYGIIYSANVKGDFEMVGNTLLRSATVADMSDNNLGNYRNMVFVDADNVGGTSNSSAASLNLPSGTTIEFARIYWGGMVYCQNWNINEVKKLKIRKNTESYTQWTAARINHHPNDFNPAQIEYLAYIDVTTWLKSMETGGGSANGTYWVANISAATGNFGQSGAYGGWSLVVAYKNNSYPTKSIRIYDGFQNIFDEGHAYVSTIALKNLDVPAGANSARLGVGVWEGDGNLTGDYMKFNGTKLSNSSSPENNIWNGTISGATTSSTRTPFYNNQMSIDLDQFNVSSLITGGATEAAVVSYTTGDSYNPGLFCFSANFNALRVTMLKTVLHENGSAFLTAGRLIYTLTATNGAQTAINSYIIDTIPPHLDLPASPTVQISTNNGLSWSNYTNYSVGFANEQKVIKINIGSGATTFNGGTLAANQKVMVRFYATITDPAEPITNLATVYIHDQAGNTYTDESSTTINPIDNSPLPARFSDFSVLNFNGAAKLNWTTLTEAYNKEFEVERSVDAVRFTTIGKVDGSGSTESVQRYQYLDPLNAVRSRILYYRLKLTSFEGNISYTKVVALKLDAALNNFTVYPNPFTADIKINLQSEKDEMVQVRLNNAAGQVVWSRSVRVQTGSNIIVLDNLQNVKAGSHILELVTPGKTLRQKLLKQ